MKHMKLSQLVGFRNHLQQIDMQEPRIRAGSSIEEVQLFLAGSSDKFLAIKQEIDARRAEIDGQFNQIQLKIEEAIKTANKMIEKQERHWFLESYRLYDKDMANETPEYILNRREKLSDETIEMFQTRLENYVDWRFPGMVIRPGREDFITGMVANDPLYIIDHHYDLLVPALEKFPERYQRRLRPYVINERNNEQILAKIPNDQFGLCLAYNFFNFRPIEVIRQWLTEIIAKLRHGGVLIMTINDCDREAAVFLAENYFTCYTPGRMILELAKSIGFEILHVLPTDGPMTWIELRRPGELTSLRGGQTLAKIIPKELAESK